MEVTFWLVLPENGPESNSPPLKTVRTGKVIRRFTAGKGMCVEDQNERIWIHEDQVIEVHGE